LELLEEEDRLGETTIETSILSSDAQLYKERVDMMSTFSSIL
jgi:hypothetical protein